MMGLPYGEEIMIVGRTMWTQSTSVTDGRTERITITKTDATRRAVKSVRNRKPPPGPCNATAMLIAHPYAFARHRPVHPDSQPVQPLTNEPTNQPTNAIRTAGVIAGNL